ncbi:unnamed protein product [Psylliodes chrysocephalus]|uniref:Protein quiver n=1 Tax=Psylliodes chrysocephalus TaxID=3402493 RepID=A0A9P0D9D6_9CUCU|nr:unnamed protein product [Psylliodes chrysocephala]
MGFNSTILIGVLVAIGATSVVALQCWQCGMYNDGVGSITPCLNETHMKLIDCPKTDHKYCINISNILSITTDKNHTIQTIEDTKDCFKIIKTDPLATKIVCNEILKTDCCKKGEILLNMVSKESGEIPCVKIESRDQFIAIKTSDFVMLIQRINPRQRFLINIANRNPDRE